MTTYFDIVPDLWVAVSEYLAAEYCKHCGRAAYGQRLWEFKRFQQADYFHMNLCWPSSSFDWPCLMPLTILQREFKPILDKEYQENGANTWYLKRSGIDVYK